MNVGLWRFRLGRWLILVGLHAMPQSRARAELFQLFELWATKVRDTVAAAKEQGL